MNDAEKIAMGGLVPRAADMIRGVTPLEMPKLPTQPLHQTNPAAWTYEKLIKFIREFESKLDDQHEVGASLVSFGPATIFHIESIGYAGPHIICFHGKMDDGSPVQLVQHMSQLNVLLTAMKKQQPVARRIGFVQGGMSGEL